MRLRVGDNVVVIAGNDKGREGEIVSIKNDRIIVKGLNRRKKHQKSKDKGKGGGSIIEFDAPMNISNVSYSDGGTPVRLRVRITEEGNKEVYYKTKNNEEKVLRTLR